MAFPRAAGHGNLPNGVFSPVIYSKKVQLAFRKTSVVEKVTNSDYFGEIKAFGDSVKIIKEPEVSVSPYRRGAQVVAQDLIDEDFTLVIDQSNYYAFKMDDIEEAHSHINWMSLATDSAGYRLKDNFDQEILAYLSGYKQARLHEVGTLARTAADIPGTKAITTAQDNELLAVNQLKKGDFASITTSSAGDHSIPLSPRLPGITALPTDRVSPLTLLARMSVRLDLQNVPRDGRWLIIDPLFREMLMDEGSVFYNNAGGTGSDIKDALVVNRLHGFRIYESNNLPVIGTGPGTPGVANQNTNFGVIVGGHDSAVATAEQISKTEKYRDPDSFADVVRGMHLYGRKILRPEAIVTAKYNVA